MFNFANEIKGVMVAHAAKLSAEKDKAAADLADRNTLLEQSEMQFRKNVYSSMEDVAHSLKENSVPDIKLCLVDKAQSYLRATLIIGVESLTLAMPELDKDRQVSFQTIPIASRLRPTYSIEAVDNIREYIEGWALGATRRQYL